jgi:hypothetical protein
MKAQNDTTRLAAASLRNMTHILLDVLAENLFPQPPPFESAIIMWGRRRSCGSGRPKRNKNGRLGCEAGWFRSRSSW